MKKSFYKIIITVVVMTMAMHFYGADNCLAQSGTTFTNPIGFSSVDGLLQNILTTIQAIVAGLAVLMIVVGGIMYITSAGGAQAEAGKKAVTAALIGLALVLAAPSFLQEIYGVLGASGAPAAKSLSQIIVSTINVLLGLVGVLSVLMLVVGGIMYITSAGSDRAETGRKIVTSAIVGLIIAILSLVLVKTMAGLF